MWIGSLSHLTSDHPALVRNPHKPLFGLDILLGWLTGLKKTLYLQSRVKGMDDYKG